jgi:hypothetical protein
MSKMRLTLNVAMTPCVHRNLLNGIEKAEHSLKGGIQFKSSGGVATVSSSILLQSCRNEVPAENE